MLCCTQRLFSLVQLADSRLRNCKDDISPDFNFSAQSLV